MNIIAVMQGNDILRALSKIHDRLEKAVDVSLNNVSQKIVDEAKLTTAFKGNSSTGLRQAIKFIDNGSLAKTVIADKWYAYYVEFGNNQKGPYIYPVRAKALRFYYNGQIMFRKWVRSHGPLPFLYPAYQKVRPEIVPEINRVLSNLVKGAK